MGMMVNPFNYGPSAPFQATVLLLGFDGADGATTTSDESFKARGAATAFAGNAQLDTAQFKFGTASLLLDGNGDRVDFADSADWVLTGDFTIEAWVRFNSLVGFQTIVSQWDQSGSDKAWLFDFPGSANNVLRFGYSTNGANNTFIQPAWTPSANTWYHVAVDRSGSTVRLYAGTSGIGATLGSDTFSGSTTDAAEGVRIGSIFNNADINFFNGWIDELRITNGAAAYASDSGYPVPTAAFPRS